jgi:hypothetical protein
MAEAIEEESRHVKASALVSSRASARKSVQPSSIFCWLRRRIEENAIAAAILSIIGARNNESEETARKLAAALGG